MEYWRECYTFFLVRISKIESMLALPTPNKLSDWVGVHFYWSNRAVLSIKIERYKVISPSRLMDILGTSDPSVHTICHKKILAANTWTSTRHSEQEKNEKWKRSLLLERKIFGRCCIWHPIDGLMERKEKLKSGSIYFMKHNLRFHLLALCLILAGFSVLTSNAMLTLQTGVSRNLHTCFILRAREQ